MKFKDIRDTPGTPSIWYLVDCSLEVFCNPSPDEIYKGFNDLIPMSCTFFATYTIAPSNKEILYKLLGGSLPYNPDANISTYVNKIRKLPTFTSTNGNEYTELLTIIRLLNKLRYSYDFTPMDENFTIWQAIVIMFVKWIESRNPSIKDEDILTLAQYNYDYGATTYNEDERLAKELQEGVNG